MSDNLPGSGPADDASRPVPPPAPQAPSATPYQAAAPGVPAYAAAPVQPKGLAITAMVLGIVAIVFCWMWILAVPAGIVAVVLGIVALKKQQSKGMSLTGIITGALGVVIAIILAVVAFFALSALQTELENNSDQLQEQLDQLENME